MPPGMAVMSIGFTDANHSTVVTPEDIWTTSDAKSRGHA